MTTREKIDSIVHLATVRFKAQRSSRQGSGEAYVTGYTSSTDFPTADPLQSYGVGPYKAFVTKFNAAGSALVYSTYLGGNNQDIAYAIAVDSSGNAYVTGQTTSTNFPTVNPFQGSNGGSNDGFVTKLNPTGSALVYSTYLGGSGVDYGDAIAVDSSGSAYITGLTASNNFPTENPFQAKLSGTGGYTDAFVTKLRIDCASKIVLNRVARRATNRSVCRSTSLHFMVSSPFLRLF